MMLNLYKDDGYTLLEVIIAIAVLSIALIPLMEMLPRAFLLDRQLEREAKVAFLAQRKLEEAKSKIIYDFSQDYSETANAFPSPDSDYKYIVSDDLGTEIKEITIDAWYDGDGNGGIGSDEEHIELNTKVAKRN